MTSIPSAMMHNPCNVPLASLLQTFWSLILCLLGVTASMEASPNAPRANHLAGSHSLYLLQHQFNPVEWYPWGEAAFQKARDEGKPILVSIGYSTCHWCHVMERESFSNPAIAARLREFTERERGFADSDPMLSIVKAVHAFQAQHDEEFGGFGPAPKFPMPSILSFLLQYAVAEGDESWMERLELTADQDGQMELYVGGNSFAVKLDAPQHLKVGARLTVRFSDSSMRVSELFAGEGYLTQSQPLLFVGYRSEATPTHLELRWADRTITEFTLDHPLSILTITR